MKFETLLKRYINVGYEPLKTDNHTQKQECDNIVRWLWSEYKCHVSCQYCSVDYPVKPRPFGKFRGYYRTFCGQQWSESFYSDHYVFDDPDDAIFDGLRIALPHMKILFDMKNMDQFNQ